MQPYIVFGEPDLTQDDIDAVCQTLKSKWIGTGPKSHTFEKAVADYKNAAHAVALNSCTAALHLTLNNLNLNPGDEVITTTMTFCATVNAIIHAGATPVLVDCDPETSNIDPNAIEAAITPKTRAIVPVHFAGYPCDMDRIMAIATQHKLSVIEDCAHAIETKYNGQAAGTFGDAGCLSFYVTKNICTGEGGMVITQNKALADRIRIQALHGMSKDAWKRFDDQGYKHYQVVEAGFKYNLTDLAATLGLSQMKTIDKKHKKREEIYQTYTEAFKNLPLILPKDCPPEHQHGYHLYAPRLAPNAKQIERDSLLMKLHDNGIGSGVHYRAVHLHPYYQDTYAFDHKHFPIANEISQNTFSLPLSSALSDAQLDHIIDTVKTLIK